MNGFMTNESDGAARRAGFACVSAEALGRLRLEPVRFVVGGLLPEGLTLLAGSPKCGKSYLSMALCCAVAGGKPFLGRECAPGTCLYLALEDSLPRLQARLLQIEPNPTDRVEFVTEAPMADAGLPEMIAAWCDAHPDAKLVIIDTLQRVRGPVGTKSVYAEDYAFVTGLKKLADQRRVAMVLVHHLRKTSQNNRDEGDAFERISGSQGLMGAADTAMLLIRERGRREASLRVTGRDVDEATLDLCFESGVWTLQDPDRRERAAYEANPAVRAVKHFAAQMTLPGQGVRVQLEQVRDWALKSGLYVGGSTAEVGKALERVAPSLAVRDGIVVTDKRVGTKRGVEIRTLKGGAACEYAG